MIRVVYLAGVAMVYLFLVAPLVGTFFIDFTNALVITVFLNLFA